MTYTLEQANSGTLCITMPYRPAAIEIIGWGIVVLLLLGLLATPVVTGVDLAQSGFEFMKMIGTVIRCSAHFAGFPARWLRSRAERKCSKANMGSVTIENASDSQLSPTHLVSL